MVDDLHSDSGIPEGVNTGALVSTMLDYLNRKQSGPTPGESNMIANLVLAMAERIEDAPMDEVIAVLSLLPGLNDEVRSRLNRAA